MYFTSTIGTPLTLVAGTALARHCSTSACVPTPEKAVLVAPRTRPVRSPVNVEVSVPMVQLPALAPLMMSPPEAAAAALGSAVMPKRTESCGSTAVIGINTGHCAMFVAPARLIVTNGDPEAKQASGRSRR